MSNGFFIGFVNRLAATLAAQLMPPNRLSILIFHRVPQQPDPLAPSEPCAAEFEALIRYLQRHFPIFPLPQAVERLRQGSLPRGALAITFDDGYADNREVAAPILQRLGVPATFFIATGFLDGGIMWNDCIIEAIRRAPGQRLDMSSLGLGSHAIADDGQRRSAIESVIGQLKYLEMRERLQRVDAVVEAIGVELPGNLMMTREQVREMAAMGMEIGGHTRDHPILASLSDADAAEQIRLGRDDLIDITGQAPRIFAYPNGKAGQDYLPPHVEMVRDAGFELAVATDWGVSGADTDPLQLRRFTPWDRTGWRFALRLLRNARGL